jgi:hypothetical protein
MRITRWAAVAVTVVAPMAWVQQCTDEQGGPVASTVVHYEQLGACVNFYEPDGTHVYTSDRHAFIVFRITRIENTNSGAAAVFVQPDHFYIQGYPDDAAEGSYSLGWVNAAPMKVLFVEAGTTVEPRATITVDIGFDTLDPLDGDAPARKQRYYLMYKVPSGTQGMVLVKDNINKVAWERTGQCPQIEVEQGQGAI